jgi:hypothetical protein
MPKRTVTAHVDSAFIAWLEMRQRVPGLDVQTWTFGTEQGVPPGYYARVRFELVPLGGEPEDDNEDE